MAADTFTLKSLQDMSGLPERTIRWYISEGILPRAESRGRGAQYGRVHLERLLAARYLREHEGLSVSDIRTRFQESSPGELRDLALLGGSPDVTPRPPGEPGAQKALDLVSSWIQDDAAAGLDRQRGHVTAIPGAASTPPEASSAAITSERLKGGTPLELLATELGRSLAARNRRVPRQAHAEEWARIPITPDIELSVRSSVGPDHVRRLERIADYLKEILMGGLEDPGSTAPSPSPGSHD